MSDYLRTRRSKTLSLWLRHKPESGGLTLSKEGWAAIPAILEAFQQRGDPISREELEEIVRLDPKGRFEQEADRLRARYGHSVELEAKPHPGMPPRLLYHGTARRFLQKILETGLKPMKRQFVHLSPDKKTAREVGRRRDQEPAILVVAAHQAHAAGVQFYPRGKGVWLSDPIPPQFLTVLEETTPPGTDVERTGSLRASAPLLRRRRPKGGFLR